MDENVSNRGNGSTNLGHGLSGRSEAPAGKKKSKKNNIRMVIVSAFAVVVFALLSFVGLSIYKSSTAANIDSQKYQAVFLTNGQVYFGKLKTFNGDYMKLTDIFYLQTKEKASSENPQETSDQGTDVELIKLGSEIHGPDDEMIISKDQVLFFENLKKDSKVSNSILNYKNSKK